MSYEKHNLYVGRYDDSLARRSFEPSPDARWVVRRYLGSSRGEGHFTIEADGQPRGPLVLILEDGSFWPVMSFLDDEEAAALALELTKSVGYAVSQTTGKAQ